MNALLNNYEQVCQELEMKLGRELLPQLRATGLTVTELPQPADAEALWQAVTEFAPCWGWLVFQSEVVVVQPDQPPQRAGTLLYGEVADANEATLQIRPDGRGGWRLLHLSDSAGDDHLVEKVSHFALWPEGHTLVYRLYWQQDPERGMVKRLARLSRCQPQ